MNKVELASYLVSLHTLLDAQSKGHHSIPSKVLAAEYELSWAAFKEIVRKEQEDEAGKRNDKQIGGQAGADSPRGGPGLRSPAGDARGDSTSGRTDVRR